MVSNTPFRPSPLSFGSPRASPFRRPSTPNSPPTQIRPSTPGTAGSSPGRGYTPVQSPSKLNQTYTVADDDGSSPKSSSPIPQPKFTRELPSSPTKGADAPDDSSSIMEAKTASMMAASSDAAAKLAPTQLREIREAFQVLDRDNDGSVNKDDVADVLVNIGQDASIISQFFPPGSDQTINFPTFLNILSSLLAPLSSRQELMNALAAFDDDDSGQIDVAELRDTLLHTASEDGQSPLTEMDINEVLSGFTGRRVFGGKVGKLSGGGKRGEVFRYQEFVDSAIGGSVSGRRDPDTGTK
ncbi:myosin regulatory light chain 1 [Aspergillus udagawae]|uniref:Myosin regulatory light chain 1 n=1 Tax=Aspergillus udagawae TaxID=91492 RepID=A0ABQ1AID8_9EURO|nr:myosin regulatory light chain 1 [Aspergillus udagawae]GFF82483.1 myosin regulatory light chain 1 [Aspergillus udagawae]GFG03713.1 myosin regulatory light chain 1 [Aspergillus udagawae]GFG24665.1 myosin regulatory light chain 1 [Aspergillus udagawae]